MKKYFLIVFCALLLLVTGCGSKNQVKCTGTMKEGDQEIKAEIIGNFDENDKLTTVTLIEDVGSKETADQYCSLYKAFMTADSGMSINCSGSKITIEGYEKMADDDDEQIVGKTKEEFKKAMEEESEGQVTCK